MRVDPLNQGSCIGTAFEYRANCHGLPGPGTGVLDTRGSLRQLEVVFHREEGLLLDPTSDRVRRFNRDSVYVGQTHGSPKGMLRLIMKTEGDSERVFPMSSEEMTIGRGRGCDLRIPLPQVSNTHCRISEDGRQRILESLDNQVGTRLNGVRVQKAVLSDEDIVQIGPVVFRVAIAEGPDGSTFEIHRDDAEDPS